MNAAGILKRLKPDPRSECVYWTGATNQKGYGIVRVSEPVAFRLGLRARIAKVHRVVYLLTRGDFDTRFDVDHECRHRRCCNPYHLSTIGHTEHGAVSNGDRYHNLRPAPHHEEF